MTLPSWYLVWCGGVEFNCLLDLNVQEQRRSVRVMQLLLLQLSLCNTMTYCYSGYAMICNTWWLGLKKGCCCSWYGYYAFCFRLYRLASLSKMLYMMFAFINNENCKVLVHLIKTLEAGAMLPFWKKITNRNLDVHMRASSPCHLCMCSWIGLWTRT
jgi:hypothetical protein